MYRIVLIIPVLLLTSCSTLLEKLVGYHEPVRLSEAQHRRLLNRLPGELSQAFVIDSGFLNLLQVFDTTTQRFQKKNHYQPIQALYFGQNPYPEAWFINCYAPGFPNLNWDNDGLFNTFPPQSAAPLDSLLSFDALMGEARPFGHALPRPRVGPEEPYTVVLFWNRMIFRQCRRLNKLVRKNLRESGKPYRIVYVNNDNLYLYDLVRM
jgi:hypothetical protein